MKKIIAFSTIIFLALSINHSQAQTVDTLSAKKASIDSLIKTNYNKEDTAAIVKTKLDSQKVVRLKTLTNYLQNNIHNLSKKKDYLENKLNEIQQLAISFDRERNQQYLIDSISRKTRDSLFKKSDSLNNISLKLKIDSIKAKDDSIRVKTAKLDSLDSTLKTDVSLHNQFQNDLSNARNELAKLKDSLETIADIDMDTIPIYVYPKISDSSQIIKLKETLTPDSAYYYYYKSYEKNQQTKIYDVKIEIEDGLINEIIVNSSKGIFRNKIAPIDVLHIQEAVNERLYYEKSGTSKKEIKQRNTSKSSHNVYIYLGDVITYIPRKSYKDIPYSSFEIKLDTAHWEYPLKESTSINTYFDVAVYTDINGISGDPNGLAQLSSSAKFITNTKPWYKNSSSLPGFKRSSSFVPFNFISFQGGVAKFDNSFKGTFINKADSVNRKDLFQRSQYYLGVKFNLLHFKSSPFPNIFFKDIYLNVGYNFIGSRIADTLTKHNDTLYTTVTHNQLYIEPTITFVRNQNFTMCLGLPIYYQNIKASANIANSKWEWWAAPSINLMYYSKRSPNNKLFLRYIHNIDLGNTKSAFIQLQLGYSASITDLLKTTK